MPKSEIFNQLDLTNEITANLGESFSASSKSKPQKRIHSRIKSQKSRTVDATGNAVFKAKKVKGEVTSKSKESSSTCQNDNDRGSKVFDIVPARRMSKLANRRKPTSKKEKNVQR